MFFILRWLMWLVFRLGVPLRYRVRIVNREALRGLRKPVLILPNHPAYIDPMVVLSYLWPSLQPRPMIFAGNVPRLVGWFVLRTMNALEIPETAQASNEARLKAEQAVEGVIEGLRQGNNHILWPSGHVQRTGREHLGAARAVSQVLQNVEDVTLLLVRTEGLWGSSFSWAQSHRRPSLMRGLIRGALLLLANFLFFMPRRKVTITLQPMRKEDFPDLSREAVNRWLENWYNQGNGEEPVWVPYHFLFGRRTFEFPPPQQGAEFDLGKVKESTRREIAEMLAEKLKRPASELQLDADTTLDSLGLDSLERMDLTLHVEKRYGFTAGDAPTTVGQLWALAEGLVEKTPPKPPPPAWNRPLSDDRPLEILGETIAQAFVERALRHPRDIAACDDMAAPSYERLLVGALLLARRFSQIPAANVGVLLPASVAADMVLVSLHLAGKVPVVLNWTTGAAYLAHAARTQNLSHVVTSKAFIDRTGIVVEKTEYLFLEQLSRGLGAIEKLRTLLRVRWFPGSVRQAIPKADPDGPAVVLFTSGSEKAPKAVPLTHRNVIADQRAGIPVLEMTRKDAMLGFLPPFHSFGLTVTSLLPILSGMRVVHHPDPTDASNLARKVASYRPTLLVGTPTFVGAILERTKPEELTSLRLIIFGAEKCPEALFDRCAELAPQAIVLEGYGVTECAPVVTVNPPRAPRRGSIGKPMPGIEVKVIDVNTEEELPPGQMGLLIVAGPTVFPGYLNHDGPQPFIERWGKRWYITGDLGEFDQDGYLWFKGRLKRFIKAGGEMISLPALEEPFARRFPPGEDGPRVAVEGVELPGGRKIVLFTTEPISLRDANALLLAEGFHGVMRLDEVRHVQQIPVLGTGKTDYKILRARILEDCEAVAARD